MAKKAKNLEITVAEVVDHLRITERFYPALREVVERKITADAAKKNGIEVTASELESAVNAFRAEKGLGRATETDRWLRSVGVSFEKFKEYLKTSLLITKYKERLYTKTGKKKYVSSVDIRKAIEEKIYQDWLDEEIS